MIGNLFAGTDESPGEMILYQGRSFKEYRGMGSIGAMRRGSRDRYFQDEFDLEAPRRRARSSCPKASKGASRTRAASPAMIHQLVGGLRAGMGYCGCATHPDAAARREADSHHAGRLPREPRARRGDHEGSAELPIGVNWESGNWVIGSLIAIDCACRRRHASIRARRSRRGQSARGSCSAHSIASTPSSAPISSRPRSSISRGSFRRYRST